MTDQEQLSVAYSDLKDKYLQLKRRFEYESAMQKRENKKLWELLRKQHEQLEPSKEVNIQIDKF